jgi:hypothetical protein
MLEKINVEEKTNGTNSVKNDRLSRSLKRPYISDTCTKEDLEAKAEWLRTQIMELLNTHARKMFITTRSKILWNTTIMNKLKELGHKKRELKRWNKCGLAETEEGKAARQRMVAARASLNQKFGKQREKWNTFLQNTKGDEVWKV